jgi:hypothetical protein
MGTTKLKSQDHLHGGKPTSYSRKARRVMKRELTKVADKGEVITDKMVDTALRLFHDKENVNGN